MHVGKREVWKHHWKIREKVENWALGMWLRKVQRQGAFWKSFERCRALSMGMYFLFDLSEFRQLELCTLYLTLLRTGLHEIDKLWGKASICFVPKRTTFIWLSFWRNSLIPKTQKKHFIPVPDMTLKHRLTKSEGKIYMHFCLKCSLWMNFSTEWLDYIML